MSILTPNADIRITAVPIDAERLSIDLMDGRSFSVPLAWYPRLFNAASRQRANGNLAGGSHGILWPYSDEDLSAEGLLQGFAAPKLLIDTP